LENAAWLVETDGRPDEIELPNVEKIMFEAANVSMVEFIKPTEVKSESQRTTTNNNN